MKIHIEHLFMAIMFFYLTIMILRYVKRNDDATIRMIFSVLAYGVTWAVTAEISLIFLHEPVRTWGFIKSVPIMVGLLIPAWFVFRWLKIDIQNEI